MTRLKNLTAVVFGTGAGLATYYYQKLREHKAEVLTSWTNTDKPVNPCAIWDSNWDMREPKSLVRPPRNDSPAEENRYNAELEKKKPKVCRHLIFIRHGQYLDDGEFDETHSLTKCGRIQAEFTGKRLHELGIKWDKVVVSTMTRAKETADLILQHIDFDHKNFRHCSMIREGAPCPPQPPVGHWKPEEHQFFRDGARIEAAFRRYFHRASPKEEHDSYTLFVAHGNVIRYFVCRALQLPPEAWLRLNLNHASITWFQISPNGNVQLKCMGDSGFIPAENVTNRIPRPQLKNVV